MKVSEGKPWKEALLEVLPQRKFKPGRKRNRNNSNKDEEDEDEDEDEGMKDVNIQKTELNEEKDTENSVS